MRNLEALKLKTVAQEASEQAKDMMLKALTNGTEEDKEIGHHFQQLVKLMTVDSSSLGSSLGSPLYPKSDPLPSISQVFTVKKVGSSINPDLSP